MTELEKMLAGEMHDITDPEVSRLNREAQRKLEKLNATSWLDTVRYAEALTELIPDRAPSSVLITPFFCDYGFRIRLGEKVYINANCTFLDEGGITVGAHTLIGHITKDGTIAGPKVLEHIVDVVLQFEGDGNNVYRILRGIKNRFGATYEIGVFEMRNEGLAEVANPSEILLTHYDEPLSGIAVGAAADGIRPYLIEVQSLVGNAAYGTPQRSSTGFDIKRLNMLLAVLEKRVGMKMYQKDVFLNFAGGFKVADTGLDLAVVSAVISSYFDRPLATGVCCAGEIGLSGEVRPAPRTYQRILEATRLGFGRIVVSGYYRDKSEVPGDIRIVRVSRIDQLPKAIFTEEV